MGERDGSEGKRAPRDAVRPGGIRTPQGSHRFTRQWRIRNVGTLDHRKSGKGLSKEKLAQGEAHKAERKREREKKTEGGREGRGREREEGEKSRRRRGMVGKEGREGGKEGARERARRDGGKVEEREGRGEGRERREGSKRGGTNSEEAQLNLSLSAPAAPPNASFTLNTGLQLFIPSLWFLKSTPAGSFSV
ncbi:unnamed protein product [Pleuronectes platessa]|uniref:Uncharacterized protein n=1 Tax=Pleuronectes platessa TaxID=8262 RepID=A0A9N7VVV0_PLEPL|nr:unnamed protein product [Pleuronectes platessa]